MELQQKLATDPEILRAHLQSLTDYPRVKDWTKSLPSAILLRLARRKECLLFKQILADFKVLTNSYGGNLKHNLDVLHAVGSVIEKIIFCSSENDYNTILGKLWIRAVTEKCSALKELRITCDIKNVPLEDLLETTGNRIQSLVIENTPVSISIMTIITQSDIKLKSLTVPIYIDAGACLEHAIKCVHPYIEKLVLNIMPMTFTSLPEWEKLNTQITNDDISPLRIHFLADMCKTLSHLELNGDLHPLLRDLEVLPKENSVLNLQHMGFTCSIGMEEFAINAKNKWPNATMDADLSSLSDAYAEYGLMTIAEYLAPNLKRLAFNAHFEPYSRMCDSFGNRMTQLRSVSITKADIGLSRIILALGQQMFNITSLSVAYSSLDHETCAREAQVSLDILEVRTKALEHFSFSANFILHGNAFNGVIDSNKGLKTASITSTKPEPIIGPLLPPTSRDDPYPGYFDSDDIDTSKEIAIPAPEIYRIFKLYLISFSDCDQLESISINFIRSQNPGIVYDPFSRDINILERFAHKKFNQRDTVITINGNYILA